MAPRRIPVALDRMQRRLLINTVMSVLQVVVNAVALFLLYRFLLHRVGIDKPESGRL